VLRSLASRWSFWTRVWSIQCRAATGSLARNARDCLQAEAGRANGFLSGKGGITEPIISKLSFVKLPFPVEVHTPHKRDGAVLPAMRASTASTSERTAKTQVSLQHAPIFLDVHVALAAGQHQHAVRTEIPVPFDDAIIRPGGIVLLQMRVGQSGEVSA